MRVPKTPKKGFPETPKTRILGEWGDPENPKIEIPEDTKPGKGNLENRKGDRGGRGGRGGTQGNP